MKKSLIQGLKYTLPALAVAGLMSTGTVSAATKWVQAELGNSSVSLNQSTISNAPKLVYGGTTYLQLYSIQQVLKKQGVSNSWNGTNFNVSSDSPTGAHLNAVIFAQPNGSNDAYNENNGLNVLSNITYDLPIGTDSFETYIDVNGLTQGNHTIKSVMYDSKGTNLDTVESTFTAQYNDDDEVELTQWQEQPITTGYNTVKVYVDGAYLGSGTIVGG